MSHRRVLFCFGLGYCARQLALELLADGWEVRGTCRDGPKMDELARGGVRPLQFTGDAPMDDPNAALAGVTHLLSSVPPDGTTDPVLRHHGRDIARLAQGLAWAGYLSTTGVYGDRDGDWVDEASEPRPGTARGRDRLAAERAWLAHGVPVHVFRLAGIYGPGRSPLEAARAGRAHRVHKPGQVFSRVHVADVARVLRASMARPDPGAVYNVCDDTPAPPQEVTAYACRLLDIAPPPEIPFDEADLSDMARSFYAECKRVSNRRIKEELGVHLAYPNYREGLRALAAGG